MPITVIVADDSALMRKAIIGFLRIDPEIRVLAEAASVPQAMMLVNTLCPQVIVLDVSMCHVEGVSSALIKLALADSKVIAVSFSIENETKVLAAAYGAVELLDKTKLVDELIPAIRRCIQ